MDWIRRSVPDPDPCVLGHPDPLVRGTDPSPLVCDADPDPYQNITDPEH